MQYFELVRENADGFRFPIEQIDEFHFGFRENVFMGKDHKIHDSSRRYREYSDGKIIPEGKHTDYVYIRLNAAANRKLPYAQYDLFDCLIRYRDIVYIEMFSAVPNLDSQAHAEDQKDYVKYYVPWCKDSDEINFWAKVWLEKDGSLSIEIAEEIPFAIKASKMYCRY